MKKEGKLTSAQGRQHNGELQKQDIRKSKKKILLGTKTKTSSNW